MKTTKFINKKTICAAILLVIALISFYLLSNIASNPDFHSSSIKALDEKKMSVANLTSATAISSVAVSAIPGDATSAIANQIANLSSYLLIVVGAIIFEKALLTLTGLITFRFIIPIACILGIIHIFRPSISLRNLAIKLAVFGICIFTLIPSSIMISNTIEATFEKQGISAEQAVESSKENSEKIGKESEKESEEKKTLWSSISKVWNKVKDSTSNVIQDAKQILSDFIDAIAVLIITTCVIPIVVLFAFVWILKIIFGVTINVQKPCKGTFFKKKESEKNISVSES